MSIHLFYENDERKTALGWLYDQNEIVLMASQDDNEAHIPLDLRALLKLKAEIQNQIDELNEDDDELSNLSW